MDQLQLLQIAVDFGTPTYVYDTTIIARQYARLTKAFSKNTRFFYAAKALTNINILKYMRQLWVNLDCVSIYEVQLGLRAWFDPKNIIFTPNSVGFDEVQQAVSYGVHINIDNIPLLEQFGNTYGNTYPICIRVNPHIFAGGNYKISTGHIDSKFGISLHQLRHVHRILEATKLPVEWLHMHTGSDIKDVGVFLESLQVMLDLVKDFPDITYIDMWSGFKVPYKNDDIATDIEILGKKVEKEIADFQKQSGRKFELWFEPGKFFVSESGIFLVQVNVVKQTPATVFAGVNSWFNHLIRPMLYDAYHHIENISNPQWPKRIYTVVWNLCETDTFAWDRPLAEIREKDILVFSNAGAYGFEMSSNFNSRPKPAEVLWDGEKAQLIRKRDDFEDLLRNQIELL